MLTVLIQVSAGNVIRSGDTWHYSFHHLVIIKILNLEMLLVTRIIVIIMLIIMIAESLKNSVIVLSFRCCLLFVKMM